MNALLAESPACITEQGTWCYQVYQVTHNEWLAASAAWLVAKPLKIISILLVAFIIRIVVRKLIDRLTSPHHEHKLPAVLRPLRERAPALLGPALVERRAQRAKTIGSVLKSITSFVVFGVAAMQVLAELGYDLKPILASAGIVGIALGFGAQNLVKDFLSGVFMMLEDQYGVGDVIDIGEAIGTVESVRLRITTIRDINGTVWYVPNGEVRRIGNSSQGFAVAVVDIPLNYTSEVERAIEVIDQSAKAAARDEPLSQDVIEQPKVLGVDKATTEGITIRLTAKVRPGQQWAVQRALRAVILPKLEEAGFEFPLDRFAPGRES